MQVAGTVSKFLKNLSLRVIRLGKEELGIKEKGSG